MQKTSYLCNTRKPHKRFGKYDFPKNDSLKIYVPVGSLGDYLTAWAECKDYIVSETIVRPLKARMRHAAES